MRSSYRIIYASRPTRPKVPADAISTCSPHWRFIAGATEKIRLGVSVLVVPYRPAVLTAKQVATIQELSGERMILGIGVGWMKPEFDALGR